MWGKSGLGSDTGQDLQNQYSVTKLDKSPFSETQIYTIKTKSLFMILPLLFEDN